MAQIKDLNAHDRPPEAIIQRYKKYQKSSLSEISSDSTIVDLQALNPNDLPDNISLSHWVFREDLQPAFEKFAYANKENDFTRNIPVFTHKSISGLQMISSIFPPAVQIEMLSRLFHRDLSNMEHQTNLHLHYDVTYPGQAETQRDTASSSVDPGSLGSQTLSFFEDNPSRILYPKDPEVHKPLTIQKILNRKLRWVTLGGQYDWTAKVYPSGSPPRFPDDIAKLMHAAFPETEAQAAILNVYSPGDTLSPHRDVSEDCDVGLISVSFGCDGLFLIGHDDGAGCEIIRLRSGDAVYMDGISRFAWHAVPKIVPGTCPDWLADWPALPNCNSTSLRYETWKGWMAGKRINLNIRQMTTTGFPE